MQKKYLITIIITSCSVLSIAAQNVGIGTSTPTRAKLELNGMVGNTTAIFGTSGNGVGLVANSPGLVLNGYYNGGHRFINSGYLANIYVDAGTGVMGFNAYGSGAAGALATAMRPGLTIAANGRVSIGDNPGLGFNAQLSVGKDADKDCSAWFSAPQWSAFNYTSAEHTYIRSGQFGGKLFLNFYPLNSKIVMGNGTSNIGINWSQPVYPLEIHSPDFGIGLMRIGSLNHWLISAAKAISSFFSAAPPPTTLSASSVYLTSPLASIVLLLTKESRKKSYPCLPCWENFCNSRFVVMK